MPASLCTWMAGTMMNVAELVGDSVVENSAP